MKRVNNIYDNVCKLDNIIKMTDKVCSKVRNKEKVNKFEIYKSEHIINIYNRLKNKDLKLDKYNIFMITDPKCRIVMGQEIEDKIINHLVAKYFLVDIFEKTYTESMCATRIGKGTSYGLRLLKKYLNVIKYKNNSFYYLKIDIKKYFYNIDHKVLKNILRTKIKDKDVLNILDNIINSTKEMYINKEISILKENRINFLRRNNFNDKFIEDVVEIPFYEYGKGCSIGNQTSQAFGLIYLCELNHYMKEKLKLKYVINYMDDIVILHENKKHLEFCLQKIEEFLKTKLNLELNKKKTKINSINNGIEFLGYRFILKNNKVIMKIGNRSKKNFKKRISDFKTLHKYNYINKKDIYICLVIKDYSCLEIAEIYIISI